MNYTSTSPYIFLVWCLVKHMIHLHGVVLGRHRDNFVSFNYKCDVMIVIL